MPVGGDRLSRPNTDNGFVLLLKGSS